jgi:hypothetical protein
MIKRSPDYSLILSGWFDESLIVPPTGAVTVALTGQAGTFTAGTLTPNTSVALTGQADTFSAGTLTPSIGVTVALTGQAATFSAGTLVPNTSIALTGQADAFSAGTLIANISVALTGTVITSSAGTLTPSLAKALTGGVTTLTSGTLVPSTDVPLAGGSVASASGTLTPSTGGDVTVGLTGIQAVFAAGQIVASGGDVVTPAGPTEVPAGGRVRAYQYIIKIDGKEFVTPSLQQAVDLLNKAKDLARKHAAQIARAATEKSAKPPVIKLPKITGSAPVRELVLQVRKEIKDIYESAARDAEIAMLFEIQKRNDEDEDVFLLMI